MCIGRVHSTVSSNFFFQPKGADVLAQRIRLETLHLFQRWQKMMLKIWLDIHLKLITSKGRQMSALQRNRLYHSLHRFLYMLFQWKILIVPVISPAF